MKSYYTLPTVQQLALMQESVLYTRSTLLLARRTAAMAVYDRLSSASDARAKGSMPEIAWESLHLQDFHVPRISLGNGVIMCDIRDFAFEYSPIAATYIFGNAKPETSALHALMHACYNRGAVLYVPAGVHVEEVLDVARLLGGYRQELLIDKLIVIVGARAHLVLSDTLSSTHMASHTFLRSVEYHLADHASLKVVYDQQLANSVQDFSKIVVSCGKESSFECSMSITGCASTKMWIDLVMHGEQSTAQVNGIYALHNQQKITLNTRQEHTAPRTTSTVALKGGLKGSALMLFDGLIAIGAEATQTKASQNNHTILLSPLARSKSMPRLEVLTNDVRCNHGAAVGQLDSNHLLYLQSRGLSLSSAKKIMLQGFLSSLVGEELCKTSIKKLCDE